MRITGSHSDSRAADEEPLVDTPIDRRGGKVLSSGDTPQLTQINPIWRVVHRHVRQIDIPSLRLPRNQPLPCIAALPDHFQSILAVLALAAERELVLGLSIGDLVDTKPLVRRTEQAGEVALDILDVVEFGGERVVDIDHDNLPVGFFFVKERHHAEDFDLLDLASVADELAYLAHVQRVIVAFCFCLGVDDVRVFPGLTIVRMK